LNILYLADPNSTHDLNWISLLSKHNFCFLVARKVHHNQNVSDSLNEKGIKYLGHISDFSTARFWKNSKEVKKLKHWIHSESISVIHILYSEPNVLWANFRNQLDIPFVVTTRGTDILITIKNTLHSKSLLNLAVSILYKRAFLKCDFITSTSTNQLEFLRKMGVKKAISVVVRSGIDEVKIDQAMSLQNDSLIDKKYVLFPRKMSEVYNHELAIAAIELLPKPILNEYYFIFLDADSINNNYVNRIKSMIKKSTGQILLLNNQSSTNLWNLINNANLVVMTNKSDGTPVTALETIYLGTPLLLSPIEYDEEIFNHIPRFSKFEASNVAAMIQIMLEKGNLYSISAAKKNIIEKCLRWHEMQKISAIYERVV
jgi:glycosyltransferase involved in cell wall biosynthesis